MRYEFIQIKLCYQSKDEKTMVNKNFLLGILVMVLVFGLTVVGCDNSNPSNSSYVAVTEIVNVPTVMSLGSPLSLSGTVLPNNATNKTIIWTVKTGYNTGAVINGNQLTVENTGINWGNIIVNATIINGKGENSDFSSDIWIRISTYNKLTKTLYFRNCTFNYAASEDLMIRDFFSGQLKKNTSYKITIMGNLDIPLNKVGMGMAYQLPEEEIYEWIYLAYAHVNESIASGAIHFEYILITEDLDDVKIHGNRAFIGIWGFDEDLIAENEAVQGRIVAKITNFSMTIDEL